MCFAAEYCCFIRMSCSIFGWRNTKYYFVDWINFNFFWPLNDYRLPFTWWNGLKFCIHLASFHLQLQIPISLFYYQKTPVYSAIIINVDSSSNYVVSFKLLRNVNFYVEYFFIAFVILCINFFYLSCLIVSWDFNVFFCS